MLLQACKCKKWPAGAEVACLGCVAMQQTQRQPPCRDAKEIEHSALGLMAREFLHGVQAKQMQVTANSKDTTCHVACRNTQRSACWGLVTVDAVDDLDCQKSSLRRPGVSEGVAGVKGGQLPGRALLGGLIVHAIVLDLIPLLQGNE